MGTMYETCAISNMPIVYGDEVVIFLIEKRTNRHKEWAAKGSANGWYNPISLPMFAKFTWDEEFKISEHAYIPEAFEKIVEQEHFDKILRRHEYEGIEFMFMHKNMYELIISDMKSREEITGKFETWADEFIQKAKADLSTLDKVNKMSYWMMLVDVHFEENKFVRFFGEDVPMNSLLKKIVHTEDEHLKNRMVEMVILHHGMETIRKMWHPMNGRGRQEKEYYLLKKISEAIIKKEEQVKKGWLEKNVLSEGQNEDDITKTFLWYI